MIAYADPSSLSQVYFPELLAPLLRSLLHLTSPPFTTYPPAFPSVIISYKIRSLAKEAPFWSALGLWFSFEPVLERLRYRDTQTPDLHPRSESRNMPHREQEEEWRRFGSNLDEDMFIFVAHRRPESASWVVPESDEDLLGGVGSRGTQARKTDDTFEGLLLLRLGETDW